MLTLVFVPSTYLGSGLLVVIAYTSIIIAGTNDVVNGRRGYISASGAPYCPPAH
ncbi:hypothetical protein J6590_087288 [Homalodisca vitripennis]|nr:hypothetical protein J6590_087288 [Homalodisca vitripennis]